MSDPLERLNYKALPAHTAIRLLRVQQSEQDLASSAQAPGFSIELSCSLSVVDLDANPRYNCLSYCWGNPRGDSSDNGMPTSPQADGTILVDRKRISIKRNLYDALVQLWAIAPTKLDPIWIDAICINQQDVGERNRQVQLMRRIYSAAEEVLVWLGPANKEEALATSTLQSLASVPIEKRTGPVIEKLKNKRPDESIYAFLGIPHVTEVDLVPLRRFYERAWFKRVWVIQEVVLASQLSFYLGKDILSWRTIIDAASCVYYLSDDWHTSAEGLPGLVYQDAPRQSLNSLVLESTSVIQNLVENYRKLSDWYIYDQHLRTLGRNKKATDTKDYVYGMLGLVPSMTDTVPDYNKSVQQVFVELTRYMHRDRKGAVPGVPMVPDRSLTSLSGLPSWVPDYSTSKSWSYLGRFAEFKAAAHLTGRLIPTNDPNKYGVRGLLVDQVTAVGESYEELKATGSASKCFSLLVALQSGPLDAVKKGQVLAHTLLAFRESQSTGYVQTAFCNYLCWLKAVEIERRYDGQHNGLSNVAEHVYDEIGFLEEDWRPPVSEVLQCVANLRKEQDAQSTWFKRAHRSAYWYEQMLDNFFATRRFFITSGGRVGLGPQSLTSGDQVWIIPQNKTPLILRCESVGEHQLLGEAYVYGVMEGQAVEGNTEQDLVDVVLV